MSASKKKQQRKANIDTTKVNEAEQKQAAYKKKARLYTVIGIVIAVLVVVLLVWNSGVFQKTATAATVGENELSVADLSYYYYNNYYRSMFSYYGISDDDVYDESTGKTYRDYYMDMALSNAQSYYALYEAALAAGHTEAEVKDQVASQIASTKSSASSNGYSYKAYLKAAMGEYMTPTAYEKQLTIQLLGDLYYNEVNDTNYDSFTLADLETYYAENPDEVDSITYSSLYFKAETVSTTDENGEELSEDEIAALEEAAMADAKAKAEEALAFYEGGMAVDVLIEKTAPSTSVDHSTVVGSSSLNSVYADELLELDVDEAAVVESEGYGYYVVVFHGRELDETLVANVRHILIKADTTTDADGNVVAPSDEAWAEAEKTANEILSRYQSGEQTAEAFAALANQYSEDSGSNTTGGLYEEIRPTDSYVTEFLGWIFDESGRQVGDTGVIRHEGDVSSSSSYWGCHVMYLDSWGDPAWQLDVRTTLTENAMTEWYETLLSGSPAALANGAKHIG